MDWDEDKTPDTGCGGGLTRREPMGATGFGAAVATAGGAVVQSAATRAP
jgi:hypothetical protein